MNFQKTFFDNMVEEEMKGAHSVSSFVWNDLKIPDDVKSILDVGCWRGDFLNSLPDPAPGWLPNPSGQSLSFLPVFLKETK